MKNIFFISFIVLFAACSKFEDGPKISLLSKKARICRAWKYDQATNLQSGSVISGLSGMSFEFSKNGDFTFYLGTIGTKGSWEFVGDTDIKITLDNDVDTYTILRLTTKELWYKDASTEFHCSPK